MDNPPAYQVPIFRNWLGFANAGMLTDGNVPCVEVGVAYLPPNTAIVEIGSFCGLSTNLINYFKGKYGKNNPFFSCDRWIFEGADAGPIDPHTSITHPEYKQFVKDTFLRNVHFFSRDHLPHTVELFSDEFFDAWRKGIEVEDVFHRRVKLGGPIGFAYIDGNHQYEFARRDFLNCNEFLVPGGFILFDDSADNSSWPVKQVIVEVKQSGQYDVFAANPNYLFKKRG